MGENVVPAAANWHLLRSGREGELGALRVAGRAEMAAAGL